MPLRSAYSCAVHSSTQHTSFRSISFRFVSFLYYYYYSYVCTYIPLLNYLQYLTTLLLINFHIHTCTVQADICEFFRSVHPIPSHPAVRPRGGREGIGILEGDPKKKQKTKKWKNLEIHSAPIIILLFYFPRALLLSLLKKHSLLALPCESANQVRLPWSRRRRPLTSSRLSLVSRGYLPREEEGDISRRRHRRGRRCRRMG